MVERTKRKKFHDKDKYYRLAKEQGLRSRAAFKLSQINRKFNFLENAKVVIDLCAAPGGWTQIASRSMPKSNTGSSGIIIAVDILPIRSIGPNVITLVGDITTETCRAKIRSELQGASADVVLCDGAPNVGSSYDRDAYVQNEIALHALKCSTEHLRKDGVFVTKLYRSRDYSAYLWVAKQFFETVQAVKPSASRSQSAEIFLVCQGFVAPTKIDPRMLDPKCVFEQIDGTSTDGGHGAGGRVGGAKLNVFHKKWNDHRRQRQGYDLADLDATMRKIGSVCDFIESSSSGGMKDPIHMLGSHTGLGFTCHSCKETKKEDNEENDRTRQSECRCKFYLEHEFTTPEIKTCLSDLKVLNKSDFKGLLTWRSKMKQAAESLRAVDEDEESDKEAVSDDDDNRKEQKDFDEEEEKIQSEIAELRERRLREKKRQKKKERATIAKRRRRAALGMDLNAVDVPDSEKIFSLATITSKGDLEAAREVDLAKVTDEDLMGAGSDEDVGGEEKGVIRQEEKKLIELHQREEDNYDSDTGYDFRLERELDDAYDYYLAATKNRTAKSGSRMEKRAKKLQRQKAMEETTEDQEMMVNSGAIVDYDTETYAKMLQGPKDSDNDDSSDEDKDEDSVFDDDDGFHSTPMTPEEHSANLEGKRKKKMKADQVTMDKSGDDSEKNPLIHRFPDEPASVKTARWFSNPLFESIGSAALSASISAGPKTKLSAFNERNLDDYDSDDDKEDGAQAGVESMSSGEDDESFNEKDNDRKRKAKPGKESNKPAAKGLSADEVLAIMPKTDKQIRHERRLKAMEREERKKARKVRLAAADEGEFKVAPAVLDDDEDSQLLDADEKLTGLEENEKKKILEARALIKAGIGKVIDDKDTSGFEVVSATDTKKAGQFNGPLAVMDERKYDSENEDYDSDDYARMLALGTMMLRRSKEKALVDASYNRYAWNDPEDLPDWFLDDENRYYRPQLPIPPSLLAKMKERFLQLSTKPIAKVAEARARKSKRAKAKLAAAKKKAEAVANSSEMSEAMKLKAISKAMRGQEAKKPGKTYVVSKKGRNAKGGKGVKLVDRRMKNDKRAMERATKKRKKGKQGGLTGSKRRRHHS